MSALGSAMLQNCLQRIDPLPGFGRIDVLANIHGFPPGWCSGSRGRPHSFRRITGIAGLEWLGKPPTNSPTYGTSIRGFRDGSADRENDARHAARQRAVSSAQRVDKPVSKDGENLTVSSGSGDRTAAAEPLENGLERPTVRMPCPRPRAARSYWRMAARVLGCAAKPVARAPRKLHRGCSLKRCV